MTDRELLELAAKAAGIDYDPEKSMPHPKSGAFWGLWLLFDGEPSQYARRYFNPLADDGDALRLAVKLRIDLDLWLRSITVVAIVYRAHGGTQFFHEPRRDDPAAAIRRAIVRAAAQIQIDKESK